VNQIFFTDLVTQESVQGLAREIDEKICCATSENPLLVLFASAGGILESAQGFISYMKHLNSRDRLVAVASGQVTSAALTMFLAFDRRMADETAIACFHAPAAKSKTDDQTTRLVDKTRELLAEFYSRRIKIKKEEVEILFIENAMLSGNELSLKGVTTE
jgi:ATP-dependent protease ClpP protease subunit